MKHYTTIYYQHRKTLKYERVDFEGKCTDDEVKLLAAVFRPKGHKFHKVVHTTITGAKADEKA